MKHVQDSALTTYHISRPITVNPSFVRVVHENLHNMLVLFVFSSVQFVLHASSITPLFQVSQHV